MRARLPEPIASRSVAFSRYVLAPSYTGFTLRRLKVVLMVTRWYALRFILLKGHCQGNVKSLAGRRARAAYSRGGRCARAAYPHRSRPQSRHAGRSSEALRAARAPPLIPNEGQPRLRSPSLDKKRAYAGSTIVNTVCSGVDSHEMVPPCAVTISLAMARPRPAPPRLVARAASRR